MYITSKRKSFTERQDEKLTWDWHALSSGEKEERTTHNPNPKTSVFDRLHPSQTPRVSSGDGQKRPVGKFSMPPTERQAKRIKVEHDSPEPFSFQGVSTPDAKLVVETTPSAPKKKKLAGPFILEDSDEHSDTETQTDVTTATKLPRPPTLPQHPISRNTMPSSKQEQRAESRRLREEALARRNGSPGGSDRHCKVSKIETPMSRTPLQRATAIFQSEPIDLRGDDTPGTLKSVQKSLKQPPKATQPVKSSDESNPASIGVGHQRNVHKERQEGAAGGVRQMNNSPDLSKALETSMAALRPSKVAAILKPQEVLAIPAAPNKDTTFNELREKLRQAELKRDEELKKQEAAHIAASTRNEIAHRRKAQQQEQRKQRLVEDAKKRAAARQEAADQAHREAERRRQFEKEVEQPLAQQERERKARLEEQNRIFMEKRKAEKDSQERLRQQQLEKQKAAERAKQQRLREEHTRKEQERTAGRQDDGTSQTMVEEQQSTVPAPVSLSQMEKDAARNPGGALELQPRSLQSLRPGELSKLDKNGSISRALGEISLIDIRLAQMRNKGDGWAAIARHQKSATGLAKSEDTVRTRYHQISSALRDHKVPLDLIKRAGHGDGAACAEINRRVRGQWPTPAAEDSRAPHLRLDHSQAPHMPTSNTRLAEPPQNDFVPYRNVVVNPAGGRDGAFEPHPNVGGKTIDQNFFFHMLEQNHKAFTEMHEDTASSEEEDRYYYTYGLKRRDLPAGADPDNEDRYPAIRCDDSFNSLEEANSKAAMEILRVSNYDGCPFPDLSKGFRLAKMAYKDDMSFFTLEAVTGDTVEVVVDRELHSRDKQQSQPHNPTISRTCYYIFQRTTTQRVVDEVLGTEREIVKESLLDNASHVDLDQANEIAINHYVHANYQFKGFPNLSKRTEVCKPRIEAFRDSLLVGELFRGAAGDAQVEVWVEEGKVAGPRNL